jgi:tetratricopeptide (TPR) repeat protein
MSIRSSHADSWHSDKWYRRAWYIWPQAISLLLIGWLFVGVLLKPIPWAPPQTQTPPAPKPQPPAQQRQPGPPDETICSRSNSHDALNACTRLIDGGRPRFYFNRAQIYFRNGDYDRAIADLSEFIRLNPNDVRALNDRGLSYERKGDYDRAIADYSEVIRLDKVWKTPNASGGYSNRGSAYEKKASWTRHWLISEKPRTTAAPQHLRT